MPYQLRFLNSAPMPDWLQQTSEALAPVLIGQPWFTDSKSQKKRDIELIWDALTRGLAGFLIRRSQCDTTGCDEGLRRASENTSFNQEQQKLLEADVTRYQFQKDEDLQTAFEKLNNSILREFPAAAQQKEKIEMILRAQLLPHLFINQECSHREVCLHSFEMKLASSFRKIPQSQMNAGRTGLTT